MNGFQIDAVNNALEEKDAEIARLTKMLDFAKSAHDAQVADKVEISRSLNAEIERLRAYANHERSLGAEGPMIELTTARQEIERLRFQVEMGKNLTAEIERLKAEMDKAWTKHLIEREDLKAEVEQLKAEADKSWLKREELKAEINKLKTENEARRVQWEATKREAERMVYESGFKLGEAHKQIGELKLSRDSVKRALEELLEKYGQIVPATPHYGVGRGGMVLVKEPPEDKSGGS